MVGIRSRGAPLNGLFRPQGRPETSAWLAEGKGLEALRACTPGMRNAGPYSQGGRNESPRSGQEKVIPYVLEED